MPKTRGRRPRFRRAPDDNSALQITPRDVSILRHLGEHRFLRSTHLCDLAGGSRQGILRRLAELFHRGYVERPRAQLDGSFRYPGSRPIVYFPAVQLTPARRSSAMREAAESG